MILFLISFLYSTKTYNDNNQEKVTLVEFKKSQKTLFQDNFTNIDTPIHFSGRKNNEISIKKVEASKFIMVDSITVNIDELIIDDAVEFPFKIVNNGQILIKNKLHVSSRSAEKVFIRKEINAEQIKFSDGEYVIDSTTSGSNSYDLQNATLSFVGISFFAKKITGDSNSVIDLQQAYSLTVEIAEGNFTILCSNNTKTNLYISKSSSFSNLIISNDTDFFALNCTIEKVTIFPMSENSDTILINLFDSRLKIDDANLSNCLIISSNDELTSRTFDLKEALFIEYNNLIENPNIIINDINYKGNVTFNGKSILLLKGSIKPDPDASQLKILSDETSKFQFSDEIFVLINSSDISMTNLNFQFDLANLMILETKDSSFNVSNINSFSLIDFSNQKDYIIQVDNENLTSDSNFYISTIGKPKSVNLKIKNKASKIEFLSNLTGSNLIIEVNSTIHSGFFIDIINANSIEFTELINIFDMNYNVSDLTETVTFKSIAFTIEENNNDTFYLTYTIPSKKQKPKITNVNAFETILVYNVDWFPNLDNNLRLIELKNSNDITITQIMADHIKTITNSSINADGVKFSSTYFHNCNISSSSQLSFTGRAELDHDYCIIGILNCSNFIVKDYHSLFIETIVQSQDECIVECITSHLHISSNDNNLKCTLDNDDSYIYINEKNASNYTIDGSGKFILKNANEINDAILSIDAFQGSFFIFNCLNISISNDNINNLHNFLVLSSEFTMNSSLTTERIGFYNSTIYISEPDIKIKNLTLYNSAIKSSDEMNVTDDLYGTLTIENLHFNGDIVVNELNLWISSSVNNMPNFYQEYEINQSVFSDLYIQQGHSRITMIPSDDTKITFGILDGGNNEIVFGDNYEHSLFSFHGNSIMYNETLRFLNFEYFFSSCNFIDDKNFLGNIKSSEYPKIFFDTNKTNITCPQNQKVIIVNEREEENYSVFEVACSSNEEYNNDNYISSKNCTSDEFNTLTCFTENEEEIETISPKVIASNSVFNSTDTFNCYIDSIKFVINNFNEAKLNLNITSNCEVTFYGKQDATLDCLNILNNSKLSIYRNIIDNTSLVMSNNSNLTILDSYNEYYRIPTKKSNTTGFLSSISMTNSSMDCDFKFNISTTSFYSSSCSFKNAEIFIIKIKGNQEEAYGTFEDTLLLTNSKINISKDIEIAQFSDFQYNGKLNSTIYIYGDANFTGKLHVNGIINCPNQETILDLTETDPEQNIILYDLQIGCTVNFSKPEVSEKLHLGGRDSIFRKGTTFIPSNLSIFVEGKIHFCDFNLIDSITYLSNYTSIINETFVDDYYGRPEIIFSDYEENEVNFSITGQANITVLNNKIIFTKSFETFNDSAIVFRNNIIFQEGATFNGYHIIEGISQPSENESDYILFTDKFFIFNDFSSKGESLITVQSDNITIKDNHNGNDSIIFESIQTNLLKIQQLYNIPSFFNTITTEDENSEENETVINNTDLDWENIKIISTAHFFVNLFSHRVIDFHNNEIKFLDSDIELYGGNIRNVSVLTAINSEFNIKDDYIESKTCTFTNSSFANFLSSMGCSQLTAESTQFDGYVDIYQPKIIDMKNITVNLSLSSNYPIFNIHNIKIEEDQSEIESRRVFKNSDYEYKKVSLLSDDKDDIFDLKIKIELNVNMNDESYESANLFMFDAMPNSLPVVTTTETRGQSTEYLYNSEILNDRIITFKNLKCGNSGEYKNGKCEQCKDGYYSYEDKCIECPVGMFVNRQMKSNRNCPIGYYNDKPGQSLCTKCPDNMITMKEGSISKSECVCDTGYMFDDSYSTNDNEKCIKCPEGLACNRPNTLINTVKILEGYYYYNKDYDISKSDDEFNITDEDLNKHLNSSYIFKCLTADVCLSQVQSDTRLTHCRSEYNGFLCTKCKKNYFHRSITSCRKCSKFPIVALVFGTIIHFGLIYFCFIYDSRYCAILHYFMLFTQHYSNIYQINIKWPPIFTYVNIIFESINLDFRRFFDCEANDEIWIQGIIFMIINCAFIVAYIIFFIANFKNYKLPKKNEDNSVLDNSEQGSDDGRCDCLNKLFKHDDSDELFSTRAIQILTIYYFMTFLTQFRWILSAMASKDGHLIVYPYIILNSKDYKSHVVILIVNCVYFFGFLLFFICIFFYFYIFRPITVMFLMFRLVLFDVKYAFTFLPFVYVLKSVMMCFFVVYLNQNWYINIYLICILIISLNFYLYAWPFYNKYIRQLELVNIMFQMFIVSMGIMAQQTHPSFEIFSIVLMAAISVAFIVSYVYLIYKYTKELTKIKKEQDDYITRDPSDSISTRVILIKYRNEFNQFFFDDEKFDLNIIVKWLNSTNIFFKFHMYKLYYDSMGRNKFNFEQMTIDVNELMSKYKELFISFYMSRESKDKEEIMDLIRNGPVMTTAIDNIIGISKEGLCYLTRKKNKQQPEGKSKDKDTSEDKNKQQSEEKSKDEDTSENKNKQQSEEKSKDKDTSENKNKQSEEKSEDEDTSKNKQQSEEKSEDEDTSKNKNDQSEEKSEDEDTSKNKNDQSEEKSEDEDTSKNKNDQSEEKSEDEDPSNYEEEGSTENETESSNNNYDSSRTNDEDDQELEDLTH